MANTPFKLKSGNTTPFKQMGSSPVKKGLWESLTGKKFKETKLGQSKIAKDVRQAGKQIKKDVTSSKLGQSKLGTDIGIATKQVKKDVGTLVGHVGTKSKPTPAPTPTPTPTGNGSQTFGKAFSTARKAKKKTFKWTNPKTKKEETYTTKIAGE